MIHHTDRGGQYVSTEYKRMQQRGNGDLKNSDVEFSWDLQSE